MNFISQMEIQIIGTDEHMLYTMQYVSKYIASCDFNAEKYQNWNTERKGTSLDVWVLKFCWMPFDWSLFKNMATDQKQELRNDVPSLSDDAKWDLRIVRSRT